MERSITKALVPIILFVLAVSMLGFSKPAKAEEVTKLRVSPSISTFNSGLNFTISVDVENVYQMSLYELFLYWNPALFNTSSTTIKKTGFLGKDGAVQTFYTYRINNTMGELYITESQLNPSPDTAVSGNATLFNVTFFAIGTGQCPLDLSQTALLFMTSPIAHTAVDGYFNNTQYTVKYGEQSFDVFVNSNSSVYDFNFSFDQTRVHFNVSGPTGTTGHVNVTIPKNLLNAIERQWWVTLDDANVTGSGITTNATHTFVYFTYTQSKHSIQVIGDWVVPELPTVLTPLLVLVAFTALLMFTKTRVRKRKIRYEFIDES